jgi:hypothetical protein
MRTFTKTVLSLSMLSACTMSDLDPNAEVVLTGTTQDDSGQALAGQRVALVKEPDVGEVLSGILYGPVTILACLGQEPPPICQQAQIDQTNDSGNFRFAMLGQDTQGSIGNASTFTVATTLPATNGQATGPSTYQRFQIQREQMFLPPMQLWTAALEFENTSESFQATVVDSQSQDTTLRFESGAPWGPPIWEETQYVGSRLDSRIFEDAEMNVVAVRTTVDRLADVTIETVARSAAYPFVGNAGAPLSRGASCSIRDREGAMHEMNPCPLSDGDLSTAYTLLDDACEESDDMPCDDSPANQEAILDLGVLASAQFLVLRLGDYDTHVDVSEDGESWSSVGVPSRGDTKLNLPSETRLRYVRLTSMNSFASLVGLSEISIW